MSAADPFGEIRTSSHRGDDDLLSAGLGLAGVRASAPAFVDPSAPTSAELRRRAIHASWQGIAALSTSAGFCGSRSAIPAVPGREYMAFATLDGAATSHRVLLQAPDAFDAGARCLLVAPASGSRGVYGAIALAGAWGLPRGCAVVYTDKGAGSGYFDLDSQSGVTLDGTRAARGVATLEFEPAADGGRRGVAVKHAHSGDHPEADWGRHVLQAAAFGLAMLDRAYPALAPFTPANTRVLAVGLSNGGGAVLRAAGIDDGRVLDGVVAIAPNVNVNVCARAMIDVATEAALLLPIALLDARFDETPFARAQGSAPAPWIAQCRQLRERGIIAGVGDAAVACAALETLLAGGWTLPALAAAATSAAFDLWRTVAATYLSSYLRTAADSMPCGLGFTALDADGRATAADAATRAAWSCDASGIPPGAGVALVGRDGRLDASIDTLLDLRACCERDGGDRTGAAPAIVRAAVAATAASPPRADLPMLVAHGESDGLLPITLTSDAYVAMLERAGRRPAYWRVAGAQHFDAFLALPGFGDRYVPLLPHAHAALDAMWAHLAHGSDLPASSPRR